MRGVIAISILYFAVFGIPLNGQCSLGSLRADLGLDEDVRLWVQCGISEGHRDKEIWRGGDDVAVAVVRLIKDEILTDKQIESVLDLLNQAFSHSDLIAEPNQRQPRTTLFVLRHLGLMTRNSELKKRIAQAMKAAREER